MDTTILSLRYRDAPGTVRWLESLPGTGQAYLTDLLREMLPEGGQRWLFPGDKADWVEIPRPQDKALAHALASVGNDLLYFYPSRGRRRMFIRAKGDDA